MDLPDWHQSLGGMDLPFPGFYFQVYQPKPLEVMTLESRNLHTIETETGSDSLHESEAEKKYYYMLTIMSLAISET